MKALTQLLDDPARVFALGYLSHFIRYLLLAGGAFVLFHILFRRPMRRRRIQPLTPCAAQMRREFLLSLLSFAVFAASGVLTYTLVKIGWAKLYWSVADHGWAYLLFSLVAMVLIHDAWFYWTHRFMHWRPIFRTVHRVHHASHSPTPWAAFCFHPVEAAIHAVIFPITILFLPMHLSVAGLWLLYMTIMNVGGHLGYELLPPGFVRHRLLRWHNTTVHHDMHHRHVRCNYGLYFNVWDRLLRTNHEQYEDEYDRVTARDARDANVGWATSGGSAKPTIPAPITTQTP